MAAARRLAAIVYTDIVGYTSFAQTDEPGALRLLQEQDRLNRPLLEAHRGRKVKSMGDGLLIEFRNALDAIEYAVDLQRHVNERNAKEGERPLRLRVGIHVGDVQPKGADILGDAVNIASRIEPLAEPGGVCLSEPVYVQVHNKVPYHLEKLGPKSLKGVQEPIDVYRVVLPWAAEEVPSRGPAPHRLAVLPLANISPDPKDEYFADGLTEELITVLSQLRGLRVIARTSVTQYKATTKAVSQIGAELRVSSILEGSVRKAGNRLRVAAQLIDVGSEDHVWAETYDRELDDIFAVQREIAEKVASSLKVQLVEEDKRRINTVGTGNVEAYTLLLRGKFYLNRWDKTSLQTAIGYFEEALAKSPGYASAYVGLSEAYSTLAFREADKSGEFRSKSEEYARRALELDESSAEAHVAYAETFWHKYDFAAEEVEVERALELNPNLAEAHLVLATCRRLRGRVDDAHREVEKALELDPLSVDTAGRAGTIYLYTGDYDRAIQHLQDAVELDPKNSFYLDNLGLAHLQQGKVDEGLEEVKRAEEMSVSSGSPDLPDLAYAYVKAGKLEEARGLLARLLRSRETGHVSCANLAAVYAVVGEREKALEWLERAYEGREGYVPNIGTDFVFESLRDDPRFHSLLKRMNLG